MMQLRTDAVPQARLTVQLPLGPCGLVASPQGLIAVHVGRAIKTEGADPAANGVAEAAREQLLAYFAGDLRVFDVPLDLSECSPFQNRVLCACSQVLYGCVASYRELAVRAGSPRAARAVGQVMATNPLAIVVPCHRIVGSSGALVGYGHGLEVKQRLLEMEREGRGWR